MGDFMIWRPLRRSTAATLCSSATLDANDAFALAEWYRPTVINNVRLKSIITVMFISTDSHGSVCISRASCLTSVRDMALKMYSVSNREWPDGIRWKGSRRGSRISQAEATSIQTAIGFNRAKVGRFFWRIEENPVQRRTDGKPNSGI